MLQQSCTLSHKNNLEGSLQTFAFFLTVFDAKTSAYPCLQGSGEILKGVGRQAEAFT